MPSDVTMLLRERFDATIANVTWVGSGAWSDCFAFTSNGRDLVIRIGRFNADFLLDEYVAHYASEHLPIPRTILVAPIGDEFFAISEFVVGQPLESVEAWDGIVPAVVGLLDALRATNVVDLPGWGRWNPTTGGQAETWRAFLLAVDQDLPATRVTGWKAKLATSSSAHESFDRGYALLQQSIVDDVPRSLGHNDLLNRNVHVDAGDVQGVFDWGNSILGDHLYDLATFCFWEPWLSHVRAQPVIDAFRIHWSDQEELLDNFDNRLRSCMLHTALEHIAYHARFDHWDEVQRVIDRMNVVATHQW